MTSYLLRRLLLIIPTLFGILAINFAVIQFAPGGPVEQMISELKGKRVLMDPAKDFAVLCANCHRMVHRCESPHDMNGFKERYL